MTRFLYLAFFGLLCFFLMPALQASATPPLMLNAQDQPLAVSETHLYVMRYVNDNGGRYSLSRSKTYIVKLDTSTSQIADFHKLQEAEQHILEFSGEDHSRLTANEDFNLFSYLANEKAFQTGLIKERPHETITIEKKTGRYVLSRRVNSSGEAQNSVIYNSNLAALMKTSYRPILSDYVGPIPEPSDRKEIYSTGRDLEALSGEDCRLDKLIKAPQPLSKWDYRKEPKDYIAYITCGIAVDSLHIQAALPLSMTFRSIKK